MTTEIKERIVKYSKELRLPTFRGEFEVHASEAAKQEASYEEYLLGLMEKEYYTRVENRKKSQIRQAGFPQKHYLHDLQKELLPDNARQKLPLLERLDFIKEGRNVVLAGNPGTGKTHIATGLGIKACQHNYKVLFTTVPRLITQLRESHSENWRNSRSWKEAGLSSNMADRSTCIPRSGRHWSMPEILSPWSVPPTWGIRFVGRATGYYFST
jgi:DNA replication protein DnaC